MFGLRFRLEGLYFATFRKPISTSLILTYLIPPYTTLRGLIANSLGLRRDDYSIQDWVKIGIKPLNFLDSSKELSKILKLISREQKFRCNTCQNTWTTTSKASKCPKCNSIDFIDIPNYKHLFSSAPVFKEFLIQPSYEIFLAGEKEKINIIHNGLLQPARPLYIGSSDDLVDIVPSSPLEIQEITSNEVTGVIEGVHENCIIENIPFKFIKNGNEFSLQYKTISIPQKGSLILKDKIKCWQFDGVNVCPI